MRTPRSSMRALRSSAAAVGAVAALSLFAAPAQAHLNNGQNDQQQNQNQQQTQNNQQQSARQQTEAATAARNVSAAYARAFANRQAVPGCDGVVASVPKEATTVVKGFRVHQCVEYAVQRLVTEAAKSGVTLKGHSFRDIERQVELRKINCGTDDYSIWQKPSRECSPATAVPGRSQHERGLALDFAGQDGRVISKDGPEFAWLSANARYFGFSNLASEPWHWSTTGW